MPQNKMKWMRSLVIIAGVVAANSGAADAGAADVPDVARSWRYVLRSPELPTPPWRRRGRPATPRPWQGIARPEAWPAEPVAPRTVDKERFVEAFGELCHTKRAPSWARRIHQDAVHFGVDPFLVGATIYRQNRCRWRSRQGPSRKQAQITYNAHRRLIHDGGYRYYLLQDNEWRPQRLRVEAFPFSSRAMLRPESHIYFTSALLSVYSRQCRALDTVVRSKIHRSPVSHLYWGDRVLGTRFEDEVLRARRRLLANYSKSQGPVMRYRGVSLLSPLDGPPRVIGSPFRARREGGRRHGGVDFFSTYGEPVRAVADGQVIFAGVAPPGRGVKNIRPRYSRSVSSSKMGRGGLFVIVDHPGGLRTGYYHLSRYTVARGTPIKAGQLLGFVGRSGIKESPSHLHFELRLHRRRINPEPRFRAILVRSWNRTPHQKKHLARR